MRSRPKRATAVDPPQPLRDVAAADRRQQPCEAPPPGQRAEVGVVEELGVGGGKKLPEPGNGGVGPAGSVVQESNRRTGMPSRPVHVVTAARVGAQREVDR